MSFGLKRHDGSLAEFRPRADHSAIVDGSGVLHDPNGIDRSELTRLAKARQTVSNVDRSKIGPGGYLILLEDKGFQLPCT